MGRLDPQQIDSAAHVPAVIIGRGPQHLMQSLFRETVIERPDTLTQNVQDRQRDRCAFPQLKADHGGPVEWIGIVLRQTEFRDLFGHLTLMRRNKVRRTGIHLKCAHWISVLWPERVNH